MTWQKFWIIAGIGLTTLLPAQQATKTAPQPEATASIGDLIEQLGSESYKDRVGAERALRGMGDEAVSALQRAAESEDPEVQWRARRLLRQIRGGDEGGAVERREPRPQQPQRPARERSVPNARDQFEDMFRRMERDFGIDIPRRRFFGNDFFQDLDDQFRDMQQRLQAGQGWIHGLPGGMQHGTSLQISPDGVRLEVQETNEQGETEKKVYEAPDLESFQQQYPDISKEHGIGGSSPLGNLDFRFGPIQRLPFQRPDGGFGDLFEVPDRRVLRLGQPLDTQRPVEEPQAGERLGVLIRDEVPPALRDYLELEAGVGLMVDSVQPDTLAQSLGLQRGDIVTAIGETAIRSPADVRAALRDVAAGAEVTVKFVRKGVGKTAAANKPASREAAPDMEPEHPRIQPRSGGRIR